MPVVQTVGEQLAEKSAQLQQACQNPLFSPEKPQPGSPSTPRDRGLTAESSSLTLQVCLSQFGLLPQSDLVALGLCVPHLSVPVPVVACWINQESLAVAIFASSGRVVTADSEMQSSEWVTL